MKYDKEDIIKIFFQYSNYSNDVFEKIRNSKKEILKKYYRAALRGKLEDWKKTTKGKLALILVYDQVPRYIFDRNDSRMWETDNIARKITENMYKSSEYKKLSPLEIMLVFFPYHHSENIEHQKIANKIFKELYKKDPKTFKWIYNSSNSYNKIISRFGRFPHRNKPIGRKSTKEEKEFLEKEW